MRSLFNEYAPKLSSIISNIVSTHTHPEVYPSDQTELYSTTIIKADLEDAVDELMEDA